MRRPVVNKDIVDYMRTHLQENKGHLAELEALLVREYSNYPTRGCCLFPIFYCRPCSPKKILEVGTAIGFQPFLWLNIA